MKLFNTLSMKKEEFIPLKDGRVGMYVCGPTVYNFAHIGNARPMVIFDSLRRYFEYKGFEVTYVSNFTDIDDKIIKRANEEGVTHTEIAEKYTAECMTDALNLGVKTATFHPKATECVPEILELITTLIDKGYAYERGGDVYYRTALFEDYGKLSHQPKDALLAGARVDVSEEKENPADFALWKSAKPGEPFWESPWGKGRPGWHIECSAMSKKYIGDTMDLHCGGVDLTFPHHENEIAQSEAANGCELARYWLHNGMINLEGKKMSKSGGNLFCVRDAAEAYGYENIRMFILMHHYRSPLNYSAEVLEQAKSALERLKTARGNLVFLSENGAEASSDDEKNFINAFPKYKARYLEYLEDDFNTADAISVLFEFVREANGVFSGLYPSKNAATESLTLFDELCGVLGLIYESQLLPDIDTEHVELLIKEREQARRDKNWRRADEIRDELNEAGIAIEDTKQGTKWTVASQ